MAEAQLTLNSTLNIVEPGRSEFTTERNSTAPAACAQLPRLEQKWCRNSAAYIQPDDVRNEQCKTHQLVFNSSDSQGVFSSAAIFGLICSVDFPVNHSRSCACLFFHFGAANTHPIDIINAKLGAGCFQAIDHVGRVERVLEQPGPIFYFRTPSAVTTARRVSRQY